VALPRSRLAAVGRALRADDDFPSVVYLSEVRHVIRSQQVHESGADPDRLGKRDVQQDSAMIVAGRTEAR
jgi:hypothetical protein